MVPFRPSGPCPARIMIVGEAPGAEEERTGAPFSGASGDELTRMLAEAGISRSTCFITNVVRVRPPANDISEFIAERKSDITERHLFLRDKRVLPPVVEGLEVLKQEIALCQPNVILAVGNVAMWALTGKWGITSWRGSLLECDLALGIGYQPKVVPTYHPAAILRMWSWRRIAVQDMRRAKVAAQTRELIRPEYKFLIRPNFMQAMVVLCQLWDQLEVGDKDYRLACDIETRAGYIACVGFAWSKTEAICIPLMCIERPEGYWDLDQEAAIMHMIDRILRHPRCLTIGQNFIYDAQYLDRHNLIRPARVRDTMLAQHAMFSNMPKGLAFLSSMYCEHHLYWKDDGKEWDGLDEDRFWRYNCTDAVITFEVDEAEQAAVDAMRLREVHDFQQSLFQPVLKTMIRGIRCDHAKRAALTMQMMDRVAQLQHEVNTICGYELNVRSSPQMQKAFYEDFQQRPVINRKTGSVSCDDEALNLIAEREPLLKPLVRKILALRSANVFLSTFLRAPLDIDGRIRCSFNIAGTETFRFSSSQNAFGSGLNLQNIPSGGGGDEEALPNIRELFIPDPGCTFFDIDLSSADLRIVVWESDEPEFKAMFREGLDPYTEIAKEFYGDPSITKKDPRRQTFKSFAHGTNYLGSAKGLAERLGLSVADAERTQRWYFNRFPRIERWQKDLKDQVVKRGMVQNVFGNRIYFTDRIEGTIFNQAAAWIPQSTVACLINRAYVAIDAQLPYVEVLLQVHDSLAGQFPTVQGNHAIREIVRLAEIPLPYPDPLVIPVGVKTSDKSWGACK
jgi:uracil-DNA glycosylase